MRSEGQGTRSEPERDWNFVGRNSIGEAPPLGSARRWRFRRCRPALVAFSVLAVLALILAAFSGLVSGDSLGDVNLAIGATASASTSQRGFEASKANDGSLSTSWMCKTVSGCWLQITFSAQTQFDEVDLHMPSTAFASAVDIYADVNGDGTYAGNERIRQVTGNTKADLVVPLPFTTAKGVRAMFVAMTPSGAVPQVKEFEIYLRDADQDGLFNGFEMQMRYVQNGTLPGTPITLADGSGQATAGEVGMIPWNGVLVSAIANFTVEHPDPSQLTAEVGYYDPDEDEWKDRYVWDPDRRARLPDFKVLPTGAVCCVTKVQAVVTNRVTATEARFYVDGQLRKTVGNYLSGITVMFPRWEWSWDTYAETQADHLVEVVLFDPQGNAVSNSTTMRVDNTAPSVSILSPGTKKPIAGTVLVNASATDGYLMGKVEFFVDGVSQKTVSTPLGGKYYTWSWDTRRFAEGSHSLTAWAYDAAGNTKSATITVTVSNPPDIGIRSPRALAVVRGTTVVAAHTDDPANIAKVDFYVDDAFRWTDSTPDGKFFNWSWGTTLEFDGSHVVKAIATSLTGSTVSHQISVSVDNAAPDITILIPFPGAVVGGSDEAGGTVIVRALVLEENMDVVQLLADGSLRAEERAPVGWYQSSWHDYQLKWDTYGNESDGAHVLTVRAYDAAGNFASEQVSVTVDNHYPPSLAIVAPAPNYVVACNRETDYSCPVTVTVTASDDEELSYVRVLLPPWVTSTKESPPFTFTWQSAKVADGPYAITATAVDALGLSSTTSSPVCVNTCSLGMEAGDSSGPEVNGLVGFDPLTGESELPTTANETTGVSGTVDLRGFGTYTWTIRDVAVTDASPWTGVHTEGDDHIVAVDIAKYLRDLTTGEKSAGIHAPNFTRDDLASAKWRIVLRDWVTGEVGTLKQFTLSFVQRTDPLVADTDGDGLEDGEEVIVADVDGDGWKETNEIVQVKSIPVARDTDGDGLEDGTESTRGTDPNLVDTDGDGLSDFDEVNQFYFLKGIPTSFVLQDEGSATVPFFLPENDFYMYKFLLDVTIARTDPSWTDSDIASLRWVQSENDAVMEGRLSMKKDGFVVPSGSRGTVLSIEDVPPSTHLIHEARFVVSLTPEAEDFAGQHTASLELVRGDVQHQVTVNVTSFEIHRQATDPVLADSDRDGLDDREESRYKTHPWAPDTDEDGLWDGWMDSNWNGRWDPGETKGEVGDTGEEEGGPVVQGGGGWGTDPTDVDTDGDGLWDGPPVGFNLGEQIWGTIPTLNDTDWDGLLDGWDDVNQNGRWDPGERYGEKGDVYGFGSYLTEPTVPDTDGDTVHDGWELAHRFSPRNPDDTWADTDGDGWNPRYEFLLDTDPDDPDTDDDNLIDRFEVGDVLLRTTAKNGAYESDNYSLPETWVAYDGYRYLYADSHTDEPADSPANTDAPGNELVAILEDGGRFYRNSAFGVLYLWLSGADHNDTDFNGTGDGTLNGTYHRFVFTMTPENLYEPLPGFWHREVYRGSNAHDNDTDEDGIEDGDEAWYWWDTDGDGRRNNDDPDADGDGIWDGQEIDPLVDSDGDGYKNMIDPDSDNAGDVGVWDGFEPLWNSDSDGDGLPNVFDPDNDGDFLPDQVEDLDKDGEVDAGETDMNLADSDGDGLHDGFADLDGDGLFSEFVDVGEDVDRDGTIDLGETDPTRADTDGDGLSDADERVAASLWVEAEDYAYERVEDASAVGGWGSRATTGMTLILRLTKTVPEAPLGWRVFVRARSSASDPSTMRVVLQQGGGGSSQFSQFALQDSVYRWVTGPETEFGWSGETEVSLWEALTGSSYVIVDRILIVAVPYDRRAATCGASPKALVRIANSDEEGLFCLDLPLRGYPTVADLEVRGLPFNVTATGPALPAPRVRLAAGALDGLVYAFGGTSNDGDPGATQSTMYVLDASAGTWSTGPSMVCSRKDHGGAAHLGRVYAVGGLTTGGCSFDLEYYDPVTDAWAGISEPLQYSRDRRPAVASVNGRLYVLGGSWAQGLVAEEFDFHGGQVQHRVGTHAMPTPVAWPAVAVYDGKIYLIGGYANNNQDPPYIQIYDPVADLWSTGAGMPYNLAGAGAAVIDGRIWVFGGGNFVPYPTVAVYDPATNSWTSADNLPYSVGFFGIAQVDGTAYIVGGFDPQMTARASVSTYRVSYPSNVEVRIQHGGARAGWFPGVFRGPTQVLSIPDLLAAATSILPAGTMGRMLLVGGETMPGGGYATGEVYGRYTDSGGWYRQGALDPARRRHATAILGGKLYVVGGLYGYTPISRLDILDLSTRTWSRGADLPAARHSLTLTAVGDTLYALGGDFGSDPYDTRCWAYDPARDEWSPLPSMPSPRAYHSAVAIGGRIYVLGGYGLEGGVVRIVQSMDMFDTGTSQWSTAPPMETARADAAAVVLGDRIFVMGGSSVIYTQTASVEIFHPDTGTWETGVSLPVAMDGHGAFATADRIWVVGGHCCVGGYSEQVFSTVYTFDEATAAWSQLESLPEGRAFGGVLFEPDFASVNFTIRSDTPGKLHVALRELSTMPLVSDPAGWDSDGDGTPDTGWDSDADGLFDGGEWSLNGAHPLLVDSEGDGIRDGDEIAAGLRPDLRDTDGDGLWDGFRDIDGDGRFSPPVDVGEDVDADGTMDPEESDPLVADTDSDGLLDGAELSPGMAWYEAEQHVASPGVPYEEGATATSVTVTAPVTGSYRLYVKAKQKDGAQPPILFTFGARVLSNVRAQGSATLYYETQAGGVVGFYRWYSTDYFTATAGEDVVLEAPLGGPGTGDIIVDRLLLVQAEAIQGSVDWTHLVFPGEASDLMLTTNLTIPAIGTTRRHLTVGEISVTVKDQNGNTISMPLVVWGLRRIHLNTDLSYAGDFQQYLQWLGWDGSESARIPLTFAAYCDTCGGNVAVGDVLIGTVNVYLEVEGSSPLAADTDGDGLTDYEEVANTTSRLLPNSDRDFHITPQDESWDCTDFREVRGDPICMGDPIYQRTYASPVLSDTDGDTDQDGMDEDPLSDDRDQDGVIDPAERALGLNQLDEDTDGDGLLDGFSITVSEGDPRYEAWATNGVNYSQLDNARLFYGEWSFGTDSLDEDTDGDSLWDGHEVASFGSSPTSVDTDSDRMPDRFEVVFDGRLGVDLNPDSSADAGEDWDDDGLSNVDEYILATAWCVARGVTERQCAYDVNGDADSDDFVLNYPDDDDDGISTSEELFYGSDPYLNDVASDLDGDGLTNWVEYHDADPRLDYSEPDTDGDGLNDGTEVSYWNARQSGGDLPSGLPCWQSNAYNVYCLTSTYDADGDTVADGDEVDGWYVWTLLDRESEEWFEFHVASYPYDQDSDNDGLADGTEYLRSDPTTDDTDGDGLEDWFPPNPLADAPPPGKDDNVVEPENIPPTMSDILQNARLDWCGWFVCHTWLDLEVTATDNAVVASVAFVFKDTGATRDGMAKGGNRYGTTFEIDFWSDYMWGYEVEARAYDNALNVMAKTAGGGLTYLIGKLVAGFLTFLTGPAVGGAVFGFFLGMLVGLFEDLSIFLHIGEIFDAITKLPDLIGKLFGNPSMLVALFVDMINAHMTRCMLVNPYGTPPGTPDQWANWVAARFFGQEPGGTSVVIFGVACTVGSIVGYLVQQFLIGTGIAKVLGKLTEVSKFASLGKKLADGAKAVTKTVRKAGQAAAGAVRKAMRGVAEAASDALEKIGVKWGDDMAGDFAKNVAAKGGCSFCHIIGEKFDNMFRTFQNKLDNAFKKFKNDHGYKKHGHEFTDGSGNPISKEAYEALGDTVAHNADYNVMYWQPVKGGKAPRYGFYREVDNVFVAADEAGNILTMFKPGQGINYILKVLEGRGRIFIV